ncbi:gamma-glutamylcyclotransferase family protein [Tropicimonas sp.]|uniref:gamma-glutamylcyclotransferase family protein n=1 Tax=Tropicimonas sp. TaxID=2067044 RepID=UPI003A83B9A8
MANALFFGYGSLVNAATHGFSGCRPARLDGWRRVWVPTGLRTRAFLSAEPANGAIDGLVTAVPEGERAALDAREQAYTQHRVQVCLTGTGRETTVRLYAVPARHRIAPLPRHHLALSYIDVVVQGFLDIYGETGARRFFSTTAGWDLPVVDDRQAPHYARHRPLRPWQRAFVDAGLAALGVTIRRP